MACGSIEVEESLLEGHLGVTKELVAFLSTEKKFQIGSDENRGILLIKVYLQYTRNYIATMTALNSPRNPSDPRIICFPSSVSDVLWLVVGVGR